jgi:hypothetical protein
MRTTYIILWIGLGICLMIRYGNLLRMSPNALQYLEEFHRLYPNKLACSHVATRGTRRQKREIIS